VRLIFWQSGKGFTEQKSTSLRDLNAESPSNSIHPRLPYRRHVSAAAAAAAAAAIAATGRKIT